MKKWKIIIAITLSLILCIGVLIFTIGAGASTIKKWFQTEEKTDAHLFTEYQGEEPMEWDQIVDSLQVTEEELKGMSTDGIIETCLNYPIYSIGMITSNTSMYAGFQTTCENFTGFKELFKREDAGRKLLEKYRGIDYEEVVNSQDSYALRMRYIEYIMSQEEILTKLSVDERNELKDICVKNAVERYEKYREQLPLDSVLLLIARISNMDNPAFSDYVKENEKIQSFIIDGMLVSFSEEEFNDFMSFVNIQ